jgi:hypothetical protein
MTNNISDRSSLAPHLIVSEYSANSLGPLSRLHLPHELSLEVLLGLPVANLLTSRLICRYYRDFIDNTPELQSRITHHFLQTVLPSCNIPLDDLKIDLTHNKLSVEVGNNLCLWKLTQKTSSVPRLNRAVPWISHLIIKNAESTELTEIFTQLRETKRLSTLYLLNCAIDSEAFHCLKSLQTSEEDRRIPVFYFCNLLTVGFELPVKLSIQSSNIVFIEPDKASAYSIERFLSEESDWIAAKEFDRHIQNDSFPGEVILKKMEELKPIVQAGIVSSIWYSKLMPVVGEDSPTPNSLILRRVQTFIIENPHHPAIKAASQKNLKIFPSQ